MLPDAPRTTPPRMTVPMPRTLKWWSIGFVPTVPAACASRNRRSRSAIGSSSLDPCPGAGLFTQEGALDRRPVRSAPCRPLSPEFSVIPVDLHTLCPRVLGLVPPIRGRSSRRRSAPQSPPGVMASFPRDRASAGAEKDLISSFYLGLRGFGRIFGPDAVPYSPAGSRPGRRRHVRGKFQEAVELC